MGLLVFFPESTSCTQKYPLTPWYETCISLLTGFLMRRVWLLWEASTHHKWVLLLGHCFRWSIGPYGNTSGYESIIFISCSMLVKSWSVGEGWPVIKKWRKSIVRSECILCGWMWWNWPRGDFSRRSIRVAYNSIFCKILVTESLKAVPNCSMLLVAKFGKSWLKRMDVFFWSITLLGIVLIHYYRS